MFGGDHKIAAPSSDQRRESGAGSFCAECSERTCLGMLVAELLYKNQILRFDLESAQEQLLKLKSLWEGFQ